MREVTEQAIAEVVEAVVAEHRPQAVYLFGSRARGEAGADSDADLLVIEREPFGPGRSKWAELSRLWRLVARFRILVDVLFYSRDEVEYWRDEPGHVIWRALREGRALYGGEEACADAVGQGPR